MGNLEDLTNEEHMRKTLELLNESELRVQDKKWLEDYINGIITDIEVEELCEKYLNQIQDSNIRAVISRIKNLRVPFNESKKKHTK